LYVSAVLDGLREVAERQEELDYYLSPNEKALVAGEIAYDSRLIRPRTWQKWSDYRSRAVLIARQKVGISRKKLRDLDNLL